MIKVKLFIVLAIFSAHLSRSTMMVEDETIQEDTPAMNDDLILVGDTLLTRRQHRYLYSNNTVKRHGFSSGKNYWPRGEVPVVISPQLNQNYQQLIKEAAQCIEKVSCVKFVFNFNPRDHPNYVKIIYKKNVCYSLIGYVRQGEQNIQLDPNKCKKGTIIHEMLHTLGLFHMHTAVDRDKYVKINWNNIKPGFKDAFEKYTNGVSMFRTSYDYQSLMHYPAYSHAIDSSKPTIVPLQKIDIPDMGQNQRLTEGDITRLNRMYKCPGFN